LFVASFHEFQNNFQHKVVLSFYILKCSVWFCWMFAIVFFCDGWCKSWLEYFQYFQYQIFTSTNIVWILKNGIPCKNGRIEYPLLGEICKIFACKIPHI
jgi:hypothetical protein